MYLVLSILDNIFHTSSPSDRRFWVRLSCCRPSSEWWFYPHLALPMIRTRKWEHWARSVMSPMIWSFFRICVRSTSICVRAEIGGREQVQVRMYGKISCMRPRQLAIEHCYSMFNWPLISVGRLLTAPRFVHIWKGSSTRCLCTE